MGNAYHIVCVYVLAGFIFSCVWMYVLEYICVYIFMYLRIMNSH